MKRLFLMVLVLSSTHPAKADSFVGTEAIGMVGGSPNLFYQSAINPSSAWRVQFLNTAGTTWIYGGYRLYYTQREDGFYIEADLGMASSFDLVLSTGIEFRQDNFLVDPHLLLSNSGVRVGLNFGYAL